ncbi:MAG: alpha/beta hydrolase [Myxococcales bacterium]|nr:alpha/beta hydrolase [Myxococcales bacterium]
MSDPSLAPPIEEQLVSNGLRHHVLRWEGPGQSVVLCHGFLDLAWSWRLVAERLVQEGHRVIAFDFRGHGETEWVGAGGYYHFYDYVLDLDGLLPQLSAEPVHLVGHSMGGTACALYASVRPKRLRTLSLVEGIGPPAHPLAYAPDRLLGFLDSVARIRAHDPRPVANVEAAFERMRRYHPDLEPAFGRFLAEKAVRSLRPGEGEAGAEGFVFRYDPLHRSMSPTPFQAALFEQHLERIQTPTLYVAGGRGFRPVDEAARLERIAGARMVEIPDVGHMIHRDAAPALSEALLESFTRAG